MESIHLLQARYWDSKLSLESAQHILMKKCDNMRHLLMRYHEYRHKQDFFQDKIINNAIQKIFSTEKKLHTEKKRKRLFIIEAHATRAYWKAVATIMKCPISWKRDYPHATDIWNKALNTGYTVLNDSVRKRIIKHRCTPEIGILHFPLRGKEPLVYDIEELFRQLVVDYSILPLFSHSKKQGMNMGYVAKKTLQRINAKIYHNREWRQINTIIDMEIGRYVLAITRNKLYVSMNISWSHRTK